MVIKSGPKREIMELAGMGYKVTPVNVLEDLKGMMNITYKQMENFS